MEPTNVSIVIPVYNAEPYLDVCLASVESQTVPDLEIILVDDGSTDRSSALCDAFAQTHSNTVVLHQQNSGPSVARNNGVLAAGGDYIAFLDADDVISPDYVEYLLGLIREFDADMALSQPLASSLQQLGTDTEKKRTCCLPADLINGLCLDGCAAYSKLYKKELLLQSPYPEHRIYEDLATTYRVIGNCRSIACGTKRIYCYFSERTGSITNQPFSEKHLDLLTASEEQFAYMQRNYPEAVPSACKKCIFSACDLVKMIFAVKPHDRKAFETVRSWLGPYARRFLSTKEKSRLAVCCMIIESGYPLSRLFFELFAFLKRLKKPGDCL